MAFQVYAGNRSSQQDEGDNAQGDRCRGDVRGCLKSPDSVIFGDYTRSFQLPNIRAESYTCSNPSAKADNAMHSSMPELDSHQSHHAPRARAIGKTIGSTTVTQ